MKNSTHSIRTPMSRVRGLGAARSGTDHFWKSRVTAVANVILTVPFVIIVMMLAKADYAGAMKIVGHPLAAILLLAFITSASIHMRLGMQVIICLLYTSSRTIPALPPNRRSKSADSGSLADRFR